MISEASPQRDKEDKTSVQKQERIMEVIFEELSPRERQIRCSSTGIYVNLTMDCNLVVKAEAFSFADIKYAPPSGPVIFNKKITNYGDYTGHVYQSYDAFLETLKQENNVEQILGLSKEELLMRLLRTSRKLRHIKSTLEEHV